MSYHIISIYIYISYNTIYYIQSLQKLENFGVEGIFHHELPAEKWYRQQPPKASSGQQGPDQDRTGMGDPHVTMGLMFEMVHLDDLGVAHDLGNHIYIYIIYIYIYIYISYIYSYIYIYIVHIYIYIHTYIPLYIYPTHILPMKSLPTLGPAAAAWPALPASWWPPPVLCHDQG